jgi:hypothetical protein
VRGAVAAKDQQPGAVAGRVQCFRNERRFAGQELGDQGAVLRPRVRVRAEARFDREVAAVLDREARELRSCRKPVDEAQTPQ